MAVVVNNGFAWNTLHFNRLYTAADGLNTSTFTRIDYNFTPISTIINLHIGKNAQTNPTAPQSTGTVFFCFAQIQKGSVSTPYQTTTAVLTEDAKLPYKIGGVYSNLPTACTDFGDRDDYESVTNIDIRSNSLTTDFTSELLGKFPNLQILNLAGNSMEILDLSENYLLDNLNCQVNDLTSLNTSNNPLLEVILCRANDITSLDLSNNPLLTYISAELNDLDNLDISNNPLLSRLVIRGNNLDDLDISNNPLLTVLSVYSNNLNAAVNSQLLIDLDSHGLSNGSFTSSIFGGGSLTTAGEAAKTNLLGKGWTINI